MDDLKSIIGKVATGASLSRDEAASAFDSHDVRRGDALADGRPADGAARARRDRRRDHRRGRGDALQDAARSMRPRTPSTSSAPAATAPARSTSRPARPSSSRAPACRSPSTATARCRRAPAPPTCWPSLGVKIDLRPEQVGRCVRECRHRLHVRAGASSRDEERRPDPGRARDPHDLQSARPAVQSGRRQAADGRRVLAAMGAAAGAGAEEPRLGIRLGGARLRRPRRDHPHRPDLRRRARKRQDPELRGDAGGRRPAALRSATR